MKEIIKYCTVILFLSYTTGCSSTKLDTSQPDWISGYSKQYPNSRYLSAVGSADSMENAQERAISNISKIFEVRVNSINTTAENIELRQNDGKESLTKSTYSNGAIRTHTSKKLEGISIASRWIDKATNVFYALAVLDKSMAESSLRIKMNLLDKKITNSLNSFKVAKTPLSKLKNQYRAFTIYQDQEAINKKYTIVNDGNRYKSKYESYPFTTKIKEIQSTMPIDLQASDDTYDLLQKHLAISGFILKKTSAPYTLKVELKKSKTYNAHGWIWQDAELLFKMINSSKKITLGSSSIVFHIAVQSKQDINPRLRVEINSKLEGFINDFILKNTSE